MKSIKQDRPRICCIDIKKEIVETLEEQGFNIYNGTFGSKVYVPNKDRYEEKRLSCKFDLPKNMHEYDIFIIDLDNHNTVDYNPREHINTLVETSRKDSFSCTYPQTVFDPRPYASKCLGDVLSKISNKSQIIIVFAAQRYEVDYKIVTTGSSGHETEYHMKRDIYSFSDYYGLCFSESKTGLDMTVCDTKFKTFLESKLLNAKYNQCFEQKTISRDWQDNGKNDDKFTPLIKNCNGEIISFAYAPDEQRFIMLLPQIELKSEFLTEFLTDIAPAMKPELFPYAKKYAWKEEDEYLLPNHKRLLGEKKEIEENLNKRVAEKKQEISSNYEEYKFLHEILTETGDALVDSLVTYLKWLGFKKVEKVDDEPDKDVLEEDIRIELENGLLIIECKGIGGTSTDADCSQIAKVKYRRCEERGKFDVSALYIVNHQRHLPPLKRTNPPFGELQKKDAERDRRGMISTWQLFNLYHDIESGAGIMNKETARKYLLKYGHIEFIPEDLILIDKTKEILKEGIVCIVNVPKDIELSINEELYVEKNGQYKKVKIEEIQLDDKPVDKISAAEAGLKLDSSIGKNSSIYKKVDK